MRIIHSYYGVLENLRNGLTTGSIELKETAKSHTKIREPDYDESEELALLANQITEQFSYIPQIRAAIQRSSGRFNPVAALAEFVVNIYASLAFYVNLIALKSVNVSESLWSTLTSERFTRSINERMNRSMTLRLTVKLSLTILFVVPYILAFSAVLFTWIQNPFGRFARMLRGRLRGSPDEAESESESESESE